MRHIRVTHAAHPSHSSGVARTRTPTPAPVQGVRAQAASSRPAEIAAGRPAEELPWPRRRIPPPGRRGDSVSPPPDARCRRAASPHCRRDAVEASPQTEAGPHTHAVAAGHVSRGIRGPCAGNVSRGIRGPCAGCVSWGYAVHSVRTRRRRHADAGGQAGPSDSHDKQRIAPAPGPTPAQKLR